MKPGKCYCGKRINPEAIFCSWECYNDYRNDNTLAKKIITPKVCTTCEYFYHCSYKPSYVIINKGLHYCKNYKEAKVKDKKYIDRAKELDNNGNPINKNIKTSE